MPPSRPAKSPACWNSGVSIAAGRTSKEIAALLYLSQKTGESHRTNMFTRLKVRNAAELVWPGGITAPQQATALGQLRALTIIIAR